MSSEKRLPSEEKPWLKWYPENARDIAMAPVEQISVYQLMKRRLKEQGDQYPAISYFGKKISRSTFIEKVDLWARTFKGMGVGVDERVVIFIPFTPDAAYIMLALNKIGAWPVMLNLGSSLEALARGTENARFAVVSDAIEHMIAKVFRNNKSLERVIFLNVAKDMSLGIKQIMTLKSYRKNKKLLKEAKNYISSTDAIKRWGNYEGETEAPVDMNRPALVTSSGGTSQKGYAKQIMDSNRAVVAMMRQTALLPIRFNYLPGANCYTGMPPFISTCVFILFLSPLYYNNTCVMDPRFDTYVFRKNVLGYRTGVCLAPGKMWFPLFKKIEKELKKGNTPDLSFFTMPIIGGDGCSIKELHWMNSILRKCGSKVGMCSGYGMSEFFSMIAADMRSNYDSDNDKGSVISVGCVVPACDVAIMDSDGNELTYGERGEICVKGTTMMLGYYNDEERTKSVIKDGWYHSGDLGSIDEEGKLYVYCRMSDAIQDDQGNSYQPIDYEIILNQDKDIKACFVKNVSKEKGKIQFVAHAMLVDNCSDSEETIVKRVHAKIKEAFPAGPIIEGYHLYDTPFKLNSVFKLDVNYYDNIRTGFLIPDGDQVKTVSF